MKSTGAPVVPGVVSIWAAQPGRVSFEVDLAEAFAAPTPLDVAFRSWGDQGVMVHHNDDNNPHLVSQAWGLLTRRTGVWSQVAPSSSWPAARVWCGDPVAGRHWLYNHRWADMIVETLAWFERDVFPPPMLEKENPLLVLESRTGVWSRVREERHDSLFTKRTNMRFKFNAEASTWQRWAAGQSWAEFTSEVPGAFVEKVDRARVEAIVMLQQWQEYPYPVRMESAWDWPCEDEMVLRVWGMVCGDTPDSARMSLERALLYAAAEFGVGDARSTEFGVDRPSDQMLKTLVALGVG